MHHTDAARPISLGRRRAITAGLLLGMGLGAMEATVVSTAMPTVIATLGGLAHYSWVFSAYLLTSTASVPIWGRLSDLFGRRRMYLTGVAIFLAGSMLSGAATSMTLSGLRDWRMGSRTSAATGRRRNCFCLESPLEGCRASALQPVVS